MNSVISAIGQAKAQAKQERAGLQADLERKQKELSEIELRLEALSIKVDELDKATGVIQNNWNGTEEKPIQRRRRRSKEEIEADKLKENVEG